MQRLVASASALFRFTRCFLLYSIVSSARENIQTAILYTIDQSICFVYAAAPTAGEVFAERFGFSDSLIRISLHIFEKVIDPF